MQLGKNNLLIRSLLKKWLAQGKGNIHNKLALPEVSIDVQVNSS
jgi:hypothetical protein